MLVEHNQLREMKPCLLVLSFLSIYPQLVRKENLEDVKELKAELIELQKPKDLETGLDQKTDEKEEE